MSLLNLVKQRSTEDCNIKPTKQYTLSEPTKEHDDKWNCEVSTEKKLKTFTDPEKFKSLDELAVKLEQYINNHRKLKRKRKLETESEIEKPRPILVTESCLQKCLKKCLDQESFYSKAGLKFLLQNQFITTALHQPFIDCVMEYGDVDLIQYVTTKNCLAESLILKLLKYLLGTISEKDCRKICENDELASCPTTEDFMNKLIMVICMHIDIIKMKEQLKLLMTNEAAVFIQCLRYLLLQVSPALLGDSDSSCIIAKEITEKRVVNWIDALISAQMISFSTSPALKPLIVQLRKNTHNQVKFYDIIGTLVPYMDVLQKAYELPPRRIEKYSVEVIRL